MAKRRPRRLVVDTDVVYSAGESEHPTASASRNFLETVLDVGHRVVMTDAIRAEWDRNIIKRKSEYSYSRKWFTRMTDQEKVVEIDGERDEMLRKKIDASVPPEQRNLADKDVHLIEAAIATDRLITSNDERVRRAYGNAVNEVEELRQIVWVNPTRDEETPIDWLRNGARAEAHRMLGA